jgi:hypothetical protein
VPSGEVRILPAFTSAFSCLASFVILRENGGRRAAMLLAKIAARAPAHGETNNPLRPLRAQKGPRAEPGSLR